MLIRRDPDGAFFEVFELSPDNRSVMSTKGRLQRCFPAFVVFLPLKEFNDDAFQTTLSQTISKMSAEYVDEMQPKVKKAGDIQSENRDTAMPHLVTEHLVSFLRAIGHPAGATSIRKNTREEVMLKDTKGPWQRSPMWLLLRVALQLTFSRLSADPSKSLFKPFMIFLMSRILRLSITHPSLESDVIYAMNAKISQRLQKLGIHQEEQLWFDEVRRTMSQAHALIKSRWESAMAKSSPPVDLTSLKAINPSEHILHSLPHLDQFLHQLQSLSMSTKNCGFKATGRFPSFNPDCLPRFTNLVSTYLV
jgi:hypothetical protein